jgi:hypothetical protein
MEYVISDMNTFTPHLLRYFNFFFIHMSSAI